MNAKKFSAAVLIMAAIYFGVSYVASRIFGQEFDWIARIFAALAFGVIITLVQYYLSKKKKRRK